MSATFLRAVAAAAPNRRVVVQIPGKAAVILGEPPAPDPAIAEAKAREEAARLEAQAAQEARERAIAEEQAAAAAQEAARHEEIRQLLQSVIEGQREVVRTLHLPVVPTKFNKVGGIAEVRRKEE